MKELSEQKSCREKFWSEIDDKEKIKRLHFEVKLCKSKITELSLLVQELTRHEHGERGVVVPLSQLSHGVKGYPIQPLDDKVYF